MQGVTGSPFSGSKRPADLASSSSALRVRFNSDAVTQGNGFLALLDSAPGGLYSSRSFDCAHSPSATITQTSGVVTDGDGDYAANAQCAWTIAPTGAQAVSLVFTRLDTEKDYDTVSVESCSSAACSDPTPVPGSPFSGRDIPDAISVSAPVLRLAFASDARNQRAGFKAVFVGSALMGCESAMDGEERAVAGSAVLIGDGAGEYRPHSDCAWVMERAQDSGPLKVSFLEMDTERGFDFVSVEECVEGTLNVRANAAAKAEGEDGSTKSSSQVASKVARQAKAGPRLSSKQQKLASAFEK